MQTRLPNALDSIGLTRILIVRQGATTDPVIEAELRRQGYYIDTSNSEKLEHLTTNETRPDLVILDGQHSTMASPEICYQLRQRLGQVPIISLIPISELNDSNTGFESGVDDCIYYPFKVEELLTRIRVRLRYIRKEKSPILHFDKLTLDCQKRQVYWSDQEIKLTSKEFDLLKHLMVHCQQVIPRYELIEHLWGTEYDVCSNVVEAYICRLRVKLKQCSQERLIQTVYGVGYKLCCK